MITILLILLLMLPAISTNADTVDQWKGIDVLNLLAYGGMGQFKYKIGGEPGGEDPNLDDSQWENAYVGFKWNLPETNVWFRTTIEVSEKIGGFSIVGRDMTLYLNIDNGGDVFVNGEYQGSFTWGDGYFEVAKNLQPGQRYVIAIRGINHPGYGQIYGARMEFSGMVDFQKTLQREVWKLFATKKIARRLSDKPEYWCEMVDRVIERAMAGKAFKDGDENAFIETIQRESEALRPLGDEMRSKYHIYCAGYAHIDLAWLWTWRETVEVTRATTQSVFNIMERFPDFKYSMGQAHAYRWMEDYYPDLFAKIKEKVDEGRWEVMGGMWVEPDCNLPSGESFVRQVLYGKRYFKEKFGVDVDVCWVPDSFGFNWNLPQILVRSGFKAFVTHKLNWNDTNKFPHRFFWWESPDGSRIMTYIPRSGYGHDLNGDALIEFVEEESNELNLGKELVLYGVGNHGGGPTMEMLETAMKEISSPAFPEVRLTTSKDFFDSITESEKQKLPVWDSELYLEYHRGTYTSQANTKKHNRTIEGLAMSAEKLAVLAGLYGEPYPKKDFDLIWETLLFNQFHDIIPGSSINPVYHDTEIEYGQAQRLGEDIVRQSMTILCEQIDRRGKGEALVVFNPSSWQRSSIAVVELGRLEADKKWTILDGYGKVVSSQIIDKNPLGSKLIFLAKDVPSLGYKTFRLVQKSTPASKSNLEFAKLYLKNNFFDISIDAESGLIKEFYDRINGREMLSEPRGNLLQLRRIENLRDDAWNLRYVGEPIELDKATKIELVESGPVRATIHVRHEFLGENKEQRSPTEDFPSSFFDQYISLYHDLPYLEVRNHIEWWEEHKMLKVVFPINVHSKEATYEIPYGTISRSTGFETSFEKARFEVPAQRWADLSDGDYGVSLINNCKYGYDIKGNVMRLSLLRAPLEPDPMCDRGYHDFAYAVYPHKGDWRQGQTTRRGIEYNQPLIVFRTNAHKGKLPKEMAVVQVGPENVVLNVLKRAEDGNDWIVRLYETAGQEVNASVNFFEKLGKVEEVDLMEQAIGDVRVAGKGFRFSIKPYEIRSFKVKLDL